MPKFKTINKTGKIFYVFEISNTLFSVFDSEIDIPIYFGSWNMCSNIIVSLKTHVKDVQIYYYVKNKNNKLSLNLQWSHNI